MASTGPWVRSLLRMIAGVTVAAVVFGARPSPALAQDAPAAAAAAEKRNGESARGSLADRMRALQSRASQVPQPSRA